MSQQSIKVIKSGVFTLIQDAGRFGFARLGITAGGPMDAPSFKWANRLCGNALNSPALEITYGGLALQAEGDITLAVTGADIPCQVNGELVEMWRTLSLQAGDIFQMGFARHGVRSYLAVSGGFNLEKQFGSVATVPRESLGGLTGLRRGRPIQEGDSLAIGTEQKRKPGKYWLETGYHPDFSGPAELRVIPVIWEPAFSREQKRRFYGGVYRITADSDRMGYRLSGNTINVDSIPRLSTGVCLGAIQVPPNGQPIVLMNDRQTIGGYPIIGTVISLDLALLAQLIPGSQITFKPITSNRAQALLHEVERVFANTPVSFRASN